MAYITFGRFGKKDQEEKEKEIFLDELRRLLSEITKNEESKKFYAKANETELAKTLKQMITKKDYDDFMFDDSISDFMLRLGLSYNILTKSEKKEIFEMEFTYDNWKNKSEILYNNYLMKCIKNCPQEIDFCLNYRIFVINVLSGYDCELTLNNFLRFVRDFFILEKDISYYEKFIDMEEFKNLHYII